MRVSSYSPKDRYRRRSSEQWMGFFVVFGILALSFAFGFWVGGQNSTQEGPRLQKQLEDLRTQRETLQDDLTALRTEAQTANLRYEQLQKTFEDTLPEGPLRDLAALMKQQLDEGRSAERLEFLIRSARPPRNCTEPEIKRFVLSTPAYDGPDSQVSIADGALVVRGDGESAVNAKGQSEAWYDPSRKVKIQFLSRDGTKKIKSGAMPLRHSIVVENREYRLTITEGAQSFAKITFDSCDYP